MSKIFDKLRRQPPTQNELMSQGEKRLFLVSCFMLIDQGFKPAGVVKTIAQKVGYNFSEEETQAWISFLSSPKGASFKEELDDLEEENRTYQFLYH